MGLFAASLLLAGAASAQPGEPERPDPAVAALIGAYRADTLGTEGALRLLTIALQQPERLEPFDIDRAEFHAWLIELGLLRTGGYRPYIIDRPRTPFAKSIAAYRDGDSARGDSLFAVAIETADSDRQRADFYYGRGVSGAGPGLEANVDAALQHDPSHGPSLYRRAGFIAQSVGSPSSLRGRFAYWCLADIYRNVAATTTDGRIASQARSAAAQYERAGPTREQYFLEGYSPGQSVSSSLGAYGGCTTRVR